MTTKRTTKTHKLRRESKDLTVRIIKTAYEETFALVEIGKSDGYMVRIHNNTRAGQPLTFSTTFVHSLPRVAVRRIFKTTVGTKGEIRDGWTFVRESGSVTIGCKKFTGDDYNALRIWALGF